MSALTDCCKPCPPTVPPVSIPGTAGTNGAPGAAGTNATTLTTAVVTVPANTATPVIISVVDTSWMVVGQALIIGQGPGAALANPGPATFKVTTINSSTIVTCLWVNATGDVASGVTISSGALVSPSGIPTAIPSPTTIANGGTGAATKANAQTNLGLGQNAQISNNTGLAQTITNSYAQVGTIAVTIPAAGEWLYLARVSVDMVGVTFASSRVISLKIRNVTQGVDIVVANRDTQVLTTITYPTMDWEIAFTLDNTAVAADQLQLMITINTVNSAGTLSVVAGSLCAIPLRLS